MSRGENIVAGLDIGTTKICCVVGEVADDGQIAILGVGRRPSLGLRKGVVVNVETTVDAIQGAVEDAELMADCEIRSVLVGLAGGQIKSFNSHGIIAIKDGEVRGNDKRRVVEASRTVAMPVDREILHVLPMGYVVDDQRGIKDPLGIKGVRLEVNCHIVTTTAATMATLVKCANRAGLRVLDIVLEPLASAESSLTRAERQQGAALVDIGGGTTDLVVIHNDAVRHTAVLGLGGNHITSDIAKILRTPQHPAAEELKVQYGCALAAEVADEPVKVPTLGGQPDREVSRQVLCGIIEKRIEEILELVYREIDKSGYLTSLTGGIVLTGGTSRLPLIEQLAGRIFDLPCRLGTPSGLLGLADLVGEPEFSTSVGLVRYGGCHETVCEPYQAADKGIGAVLKLMRGWFREFF